MNNSVLPKYRGTMVTGADSWLLFRNDSAELYGGECYPAGYFRLVPQFDEEDVPNCGHAAMERRWKQIGLHLAEEVVETVEERGGGIFGR